MSFRYHVTYGKHKKLIATNQRREMAVKVKDAFHITCDSSSIQLQVFNSEWDDWVDVEEPESLPAKGRLKAFIKEQPVNARSAEKVSARIIQEAVNLSDVQVISVSNEDTNKTLSISLVKPAVADNVWMPGEYNLPYHRLGKTLQDSLSKGIPLTKTLKGQFLDVLYDDISQFTHYPTSQQYTEVAKTILQLYPHLSTGYSYADSLILWKTSLSDKFRNARRRRCLVDIPEVQRRKKKRESLNESPTASEWEMRACYPQCKEED